ncbi:MAG TPA: TonB family protein [Povalibacter sp.]|nr:TonB family protein [Povalibacter sp.]
MQRRQPDAPLGPLKAAGTFGGDILDVVVLSADEALLLTLQEAAGTTHVIWHAPSPDAAVDLLVGGHCGILIADLNLVRTDAAGLLERLQAQFPELVLLATGRRDQEGAVAGLISKGSVYRFLHKPVSPARADLFLAAATRRHHELAPTTSHTLATVRHLTQPSNRTAVIAGGAIAAVLLSGVGWWMLRPKAPAAPLPAPVATAPARPAVVIADELAAAQRAFAAGQLISPPGDNALAHYRTVLAADAGNAAASAGVQDVLDALETQVTDALQKREAPVAAQALKALQTAQPDHPRLDELREQLITLSRSATAEPAAAKLATPRKAAPVAQRAPTVTATPEAIPARQSEPAPEVNREPPPRAEDVADARVDVAALLAPAVKLRETNQLIEPAGNNAYEALQAVISQHPDAVEVRAERQRLALALLEHARTSLAGGDTDRADLLTARAESLIPGMNATQSLRQQIADSRAARAAQAPVAAAGIKRIREIPAVYPIDARRRGIEGWVDLAFTIAADGSTQDLVVREAQPVGVFDKAATDALRRWRFEPIVRNGAAVAQRATLRMEFSLR